jgi:sugar lactone lactonase YvrE
VPQANRGLIQRNANMQYGTGMPKIISREGNRALPPLLDAVVPGAALPGGEIEVVGANLGPFDSQLPSAFVDGTPAHVLLSRSRRLILKVPETHGPGAVQVQQGSLPSNILDVKVAQLLTSEVHAVGNPAIDIAGNVFVTFSGPRGQQTPVSVFRVSPSGEQEDFLTGIMNATGLALDPSGYLYVSSRHEGTVYRVSPDGASSVYAEGMGVATGVAFDEKGDLYVGDRSGTIFKISRDRQIFVFATLEPSVAAYHLAFGLDGILYVTGPTTSSHDNVYAIDHDGATRVFYGGLGRPQGLAVDSSGDLYVAASLKGKRGIVRITRAGNASLVLAGPNIVGLALGRDGTAVLATGNAVYYVPLGIEGLRFF